MSRRGPPYPEGDIDAHGHGAGLEPAIDWQRFNRGPISEQMWGHFLDTLRLRARIPSKTFGC